MPTEPTSARRLHFGVYLPQVAMDFEDILSRALLCESLGFDSFWLFDHLYSPGLPDAPALEGWILATALLARTERLRVGHLVSCNNFRHPVVLARMATTLDVISGGRLELGLGSGSYEPEHDEAGLPWGSLAERSSRLAESLEIITGMLAGGRTSFQGRHYTVRDVPNVPGPVQLPRPPIHIGGASIRHTLPIVARHADVWNVPTYALDRLDELGAALDAECLRIGRDPATIARSLEAVLAVAPAGQLDDAIATAQRRFGDPGFGLEHGLVGTPPQVIDRIGDLVERGFTHFAFFVHDRGKPETLELFAQEVMARL